MRKPGFRDPGEIRRLVLPNAAGGRDQGFEIRINRPRAVSYQPSAQNSLQNAKKSRIWFQENPFFDLVPEFQE
jgi:hypothetical protein